MFHRTATLLRRGENICVASHLSPDGDAIGSTLALGLGLMDLGKRVVLLNVDGVPRTLQFLPFSDRIVRTLEAPESIDTLILVDCAQPHRAGKPVEALAERLPPLLIDHHIPQGVTPEAHCIDPAAAATGEVIYRLLQECGVAVSPPIASNLYCTIVTDTGDFRYSNTSPAILRLAATLIECGADPWWLACNLNEQHDPVVYALLRRSLQTVQIELGGRYAHMTITQEMLQEAEALPEHAEEFVNYPRSLAGVEVAALFRELPDGGWKVSLRSKRNVDVAAIASLFGGGGHKHAAGCRFGTSLAAVRHEMITQVGTALERRIPASFQGHLPGS